MFEEPIEPKIKNATTRPTKTSKIFCAEDKPEVVSGNEVVLSIELSPMEVELYTSMNQKIVNNVTEPTKRPFRLLLLTTVSLTEYLFRDCADESLRRRRK